MAVYEYQCSSCHKVFERMLPMSKSDEAVKCPYCGGKGERLISVFASTHEGAVRVPDKDALRE